MRLVKDEYTLDFKWETVVQNQWRKYPNPINTAVLGIDVLDRYVSDDGKLHSHRIITQDWSLSAWVQSLIGANRDAYAHEYSIVDPKARTMEMFSTNLTFCNYVHMKERMLYAPHPEDSSKTLTTKETIITVKNVPLTSYMESMIQNSAASNAVKGRMAMEWVIEKFTNEGKSISDYLDKLKIEVSEFKDLVSDNVIKTATASIDDLQKKISLSDPVFNVQRGSILRHIEADPSRFL